MKRVSLLAGVLCLVFAACCSSGKKQGEGAEKECGTEKSACCQEMTEEEKAACKEFCEMWEDFDNQPEDVQKELILKAKAKIDKCKAEMAAKKAECEHEKPECEVKKAACEAKKAECKAKWENFDNLSLEEQKALIDKKMQCKKENKTCCKEKGKECSKAKEGSSKCGRH